MMDHEMPMRASDHHRLMERLANQRITDDQAREIMRSAEAHRAFIAALCAGMPYAAGKRRP